MHANPYQAPTAISKPAAAPGATASGNESDCDGIPHEGFLQYRRAVACCALTMSLFFALISVDMFRQISMVDGAISLTMPTVLLMASARVICWRKAADAELTLSKYSHVSQSIRRHCLWAGPAVLAVGVAQLIWAPEGVRIFVCPCLVSGPLLVGCAFLSPRGGGVTTAT